MSIRTLIIDDEPIALEKLKSYTEQIPALYLEKECSDGLEALNYLNEHDVDLIITDINMPDLNGVDLIKSLKGSPFVIFITAYSEFAVDSYSVSAVDYLLKPYSFVDFSRAVNKVVERFQAKKKGGMEYRDSLFVKVDHRLMRVEIPSIRYIKGYGEYLQIFIEDKSHPIVTLSSFASIKEKLPDNFIQVHRSYIVNVNHIEVVDRKRIVMDKDTEIPVGDSYKNMLQDYLSRFGIH